MSALIRVNYIDSGNNPQVDALVVLQNYPYLHVESAGSSWVVKMTTVSAPTDQTATLTGTYTSRAEAVAALSKLGAAIGQVLDITAL